ncbi:MAG: arsenite efflux transporter metallochaperone ArsD [Nitrospirae bacterium]|nr:arsenite efflux transporter metallochaperone ArsD [Nitrospirota bacterium]
MKIEIYDPAMCCSSGLCGPGIDPVLVKMNKAVLALKKQGVEVVRYNLAQQPKEFLANKTAAELLHKNGKKVLPVTVINGELFRTGEYPDYEELCGALNIEPMMKEKPMSFLELRVKSQELRVRSKTLIFFPILNS